MAFFVKDKDILNRQNGTKLLLFRNFACKDNGQYKASYPNFNAVVTEDCASRLADEGYNVKEYEDRDGNIMYKIKINCRFDNIPPKVYKVCGNRKIRLDEDTIADLDRDEIVGLDMTLSRSSGGATYLSTGYFTIDEDEIDKLYDFGDDEEEIPFE